MPVPQIHGVFGDPPPRLARVPPEAKQFSPLAPGSDALDVVPPSSLAGMAMLAMPGTLERRHDLALMLRALAPGAPFTVLAPKASGGGRLSQELAEFGCAFEETGKAHHRVCTGFRPARQDDALLTAAIAGGAPRRLDALGFWTQPGIFSWDRIDPGSALLLETLPPLSGHGADFGCGFGLLARAVLAAPTVARLDLIDIDRRAVGAAARNLDDPRVTVRWHDLRVGIDLNHLDFVVTNPPFHDAGIEDKRLGHIFIRRAAEALRKGGRLWLVANRHLPYETVLAAAFRNVTPRAEAQGFKVIEAVK